MDRFLPGARTAGAASQAAPAPTRGGDPEGLAELIVESAAFESGVATSSTWEVLTREKLARKEPPTWHCSLCVAHGQNDGGGKGAQNVLLHMITKHVDRLPLEIARTVIVKMRTRLDNEVKKLHDLTGTRKGDYGALVSHLAVRQQRRNSEAAHVSDQSPNVKLNKLALALAEGTGASATARNFVESDMVARLVHFFDPEFPLPSSRLVAKHESDVYNAALSRARAKLEDLQRGYDGVETYADSTLCMSADMWSADKKPDCPGYLVSTMHYVDPETFEVCSLPLSYIYAPGDHTGAHLFSLFKRVLQRPFAAADSLESNVKPIRTSILGIKTSDRGSNMVSFFSSIDALQGGADSSRACVVHLMETCTKNALKDERVSSAIAVLINDMRRIVVLFRKAPKRMRALAAAGLRLRNPVVVKPMGTFTKTRFYTVSVQGEKVFHNLPALLAVDVNALELRGSNGKGASIKSQFQARQLRLSSANSTGMIRDLLNVLGWLKDFEMAFSSESFVSLSRLPSALDNLAHLFGTTELQADVKTFADVLIQQIRDDFFKHSKMELPYVACFLDPETHKTLAWADVVPTDANRAVLGEVKQRRLTAITYLVKEMTTIRARVVLAPKPPSPTTVVDDLDEFDQADLNASASTAGETEVAKPSEWLKRTFVPLLESRAKSGTSFASFYSGCYFSARSAAQGERSNWLALLTIVRRVCAVSAAAIACERGGSLLTRMVTEERTLLDPNLVSKLAMVRHLTRGTWARKPRYKKPALAALMTKKPKSSGIFDGLANLSVMSFGASTVLSSKASSSSSSSSSSSASSSSSSSSSSSAFVIDVENSDSDTDDGDSDSDSGVSDDADDEDEDEVDAARNPLDAFVVDPARVKAAAEMARRAREFASLPTAYLDLGFVDEDTAGAGADGGDVPAPAPAAEVQRAPAAPPAALAVAQLKRPRPG